MCPVEWIHIHLINHVYIFVILCIDVVALDNIFNHIYLRWSNGIGMIGFFPERHWNNFEELGWNLLL